VWVCARGGVGARVRACVRLSGKETVTPRGDRVAGLRRVCARSGVCVCARTRVRAHACACAVWLQDSSAEKSGRSNSANQSAGFRHEARSTIDEARGVDGALSTAASHRAMPSLKPDCLSRPPQCACVRVRLSALSNSDNLRQPLRRGGRRRRRCRRISGRRAGRRRAAVVKREAACAVACML
jgi:hypothetical protein